MKHELSNNQKAIHELLIKARKPLKAYSILFETQKLGIRSPTQVYRALDKLIELGKVHKIESKNSYLACKTNNCSDKLSTSFLICKKCENVIEIEEFVIKEKLKKICEGLNIKYKEHNLEIFGQCEKCS